jgi:hypothetical protein
VQLAVAGTVAVGKVLAAELAGSRVRQAGKDHRVHPVFFLLARELVQVARGAGVMPYRTPDRPLRGDQLVAVLARMTHTTYPLPWSAGLTDTISVSCC